MCRPTKLRTAVRAHRIFPKLVGCEANAITSLINNSTGSPLKIEVPPSVKMAFKAISAAIFASLRLLSHTILYVPLRSGLFSLPLAIVQGLQCNDSSILHRTMLNFHLSKQSLATRTVLLVFASIKYPNTFFSTFLENIEIRSIAPRQ